MWLFKYTWLTIKLLLTIILTTQSLQLPDLRFVRSHQATKRSHSANLIAANGGTPWHDGNTTTGNEQSRQQQRRRYGESSGGGGAARHRQSKASLLDKSYRVHELEDRKGEINRVKKKKQNKGVHLTRIACGAEWDETTWQTLN
jgi:hypothetical protein